MSTQVASELQKDLPESLKPWLSPHWRNAGRLRSGRSGRQRRGSGRQRRRRALAECLAPTNTSSPNQASTLSLVGWPKSQPFPKQPYQQYPFLGFPTNTPRPPDFFLAQDGPEPTPGTFRRLPGGHLEDDRAHGKGLVCARHGRPPRPAIPRGGRPRKTLGLVCEK